MIKYESVDYLHKYQYFSHLVVVGGLSGGNAVDLTVVHGVQLEILQSYTYFLSVVVKLILSVLLIGKICFD